MAEAFALGDRVGVIDDGGLVACDRPAAIAASADAARAAARGHAGRPTGTRWTRDDAGLVLARAPRRAGPADLRSTSCWCWSRPASPSRLACRPVCWRCAGHGWAVPCWLRPAWHRRSRVSRCWGSCCRCRSSAASDRARRWWRLTLYALLPIVRTTAAGLAQHRPVRHRIWRRDGHDVAAVADDGGAAAGGAVHRRRAFAWPPSSASARRRSPPPSAPAGLGEYIFRGLSMVDATTILAGAIPAAALALTADGLLALARARAAIAARRHADTGRAEPSPPSCSAPRVLSPVYARGAAGAVVVGSKNFTEQVILGEIVAQALEAEGVPVVRKLNLGGTFICDRALALGRHRRLRRVHRDRRHGRLSTAGRRATRRRCCSGRASSTRPAA